MNFTTYGPFQLKEMSKTGIDELYQDIKTINADLQFAVGVYVVAAKDAKGRLVPWYVGKTGKEFGARLRQHFDAEKFHALSSKSGSLFVFLLAHVTNSGKIKKVTDSAKRGLNLTAIDHLEFTLIGSCLLKNPDILNKSGKSFHASIYVPGYLNSPPDKRDEAAQSFASMLGAK